MKFIFFKGQQSYKMSPSAFAYFPVIFNIVFEALEMLICIFIFHLGCIHNIYYTFEIGNFTETYPNSLVFREILMSRRIGNFYVYFIFSEAMRNIYNNGITILSRAFPSKSKRTNYLFIERKAQRC